MPPSSGGSPSSKDSAQNRSRATSRRVLTISKPPRINKRSFPSFSLNPKVTEPRLLSTTSVPQRNRLSDFEPATFSSFRAPNDVNNNQPPHFRLEENNYSSGDDEPSFDDTASSLSQQAIDSVPITHTKFPDNTIDTRLLATPPGPPGDSSILSANHDAPTLSCFHDTVSCLSHQAIDSIPTHTKFPDNTIDTTRLPAIPPGPPSDSSILSTNDDTPTSITDATFTPPARKRSHLASPGHAIHLRTRTVAPLTPFAIDGRSRATRRLFSIVSVSEEEEELEETREPNRTTTQQVHGSDVLCPEVRPAAQPTPRHPHPPSSLESTEVGTRVDDANRRSTLPQLFVNIPESTQVKFLRLASLPTPYRPVPTRLIKPLFQLLQKLSSAFLDTPSDEALFNILAVPKLAIHPATSLQSQNIKLAIRHLHDFPNVPWPDAPPQHPVQPQNRLRTIEKMVNNGRLGTAANLVREDTKIAPIDKDTIASLKAKHPSGHRNPFGSEPGPAPGLSPSQDDVLSAINSFKAFSAPGISGWTVPLLRLATKAPKVVEFLTTLTGMVGQGSAPGQSMLCASRLTPLLKKDGGLRPIAVGDLLYRLVTKVLLRHHFKPDWLLPTQFGVGTKGGVEPVIRTIQRAINGDLDQPYTTLTSLDFSNAFNTVDRTDIALALKEYAPSLYRTAKWAYNSPTDLVLGDNILKSSTGVRQGDPLGPVLFSLAIRPTLERLSLSLGPDQLVLSYLDDINILSSSTQPLSTLNQVTAILDNQASSLRLNRTKCTEMTLDTIKREGLSILGSRIGSTNAQASFLDAKVDCLLGQVKNLGSLPHQHALLLLRQCLQQDLRHLQRSLASDTKIKAAWAKLDLGLLNEVRRLRGRVSNREGDRSDIENSLMALPVRLGGMGILSHQDIAPLALTAANETSDRLINSFLPLSPPVDASQQAQPRSQREGCKELWERQRNDLLSSLDDAERKIMTESASTLGRKWLNTIPYYSTLRLTDFEVSTAIHYRTLSTSPLTTCPWCSKSNSLGHDEVCLARPRQTVARHDSVARILHSTLKTIDPTAEHEPHSFEGRRRNDIRLRGSFKGSVDFDIKVYTLLGEKATKTTTKPADGVPLPRHIILQASKYLEQVERRAILAKPLTNGRFIPLVFSAGGMMSKTTGEELETWGEKLEATTFQRMKTLLSIAFLKARARSFEAGRSGGGRIGLEELTGIF